MKWFDKMERKFGRYAIRNLMMYMSVISMVGTILGIARPELYQSYLSFDVYKILHGQVWRLVTFLFYPSVSMQQDSSFFFQIILYGVVLYVYYSIGNTLERVWGSFRFNAFYFFGIILSILITFGYYFVLVGANGSDVAVLISANLSQVINLSNLNLSMLLVFAFLFPNTQFLIYFIIPVKAKWLGYLYLAFSLYRIVTSILSGNFLQIMDMLLLVAALVDFVIFHQIARNPQGFAAAMRHKKRQVVYRNTAKKATLAGAGARHRCAICGRTEIEAPHLEFRYCSKCEGNYEYCSEHLFTHEHVRRGGNGENHTNEGKE